MLRRLDLVEQAMAELDQVIVDACRPWQHQIELLQTIPGVGPKVAEVFIAETGGDMYPRPLGTARTSPDEISRQWEAALERLKAFVEDG
jgi:transposase